MMYKFSKKSLSKLKGVDPILIAIMVDSIRNSPYDFGIPTDGGFRTAERQRKLFDKRPKVTNCDGTVKKSRHQSGSAVDIFGYVNGEATWDKEILTKIAMHIKVTARDKYNVDLTWGGDWTSFKDYPHFQL